MMDAHLFRPGIDIPGRPDFKQKDFGKVMAKHFKPYAHSAIGLGYLIHRVVSVEVQWYAGHYDWMQRLEVPHVTAKCACGRMIYLNSGEKSGKMCETPKPNAVLCGTCHGELPTFSKRRTEQIKKQWAKDHLRCDRGGN